MMKLTRNHAQAVLDMIDVGLCVGLGRPVPGEMCVEAAVSFALGLPHGDNPECVLPAIRELKINVNDWGGWQSNASRAKALRRLGVAQLGSNGTVDPAVFAERVSMLVIKTCVVDALRRVAKIIPSHADSLKKAADDCVSASNLAAARAASDAASDAARAASDAASDAEKVMSAFCEGVVQILIEMDAPGCQWLDLTE